MKKIWNFQLKFWCKPNYERLLISICIDEEIDHYDTIGHKKKHKLSNFGVGL